MLKFIADVHISPLTVKELYEKGYNIIRVTDRFPATSSDNEIVQLAYRVILAPPISRGEKGEGEGLILRRDFYG